MRVPASKEKQLLSRNVIRALEARFGVVDMTPAQAITRLVKLGMKTGNAQRLLDEDSSPRLQSIAEAARLIRVPLASLLSSDAPKPPLADYQDRREVGESDWVVLQDVLLVLPPNELERIRQEAERLRRVAREQIEAVVTRPPRSI